MNNLEFKPQIFRIEFEGFHGNAIFDLLTVDGETPDCTVYFMCKGDAPSSGEQDIISERVETGEYEMISFEDTDYELSNFDIDLNIFDTSGEGYREIVKKLKNQLA